MKRGALRRGLPVLFLVGVIVILILVANAVAETWHLVSPLNSSGSPAYSAENSVTFYWNLTISEEDIGNSTDNNVTGFALYFGQPDTWRINQTNGVPWTNNTLWNWTIADINDGTYNWSVSITINNSEFFLNNSNITLLVDTVEPNVSLIWPVDGNYSGTLSINASANDSFSGMSAVSYWIDNYTVSSGLFNMSNTSHLYNASYPTTAFSDGRYSLNIIAYDVAGAQNWTYDAAVMTFDNTAPSVNTIFLNSTSSSSGEGYLEQGILTINATITDGNGTGVYNASFRYANGTNASNWLPLTKFNTSNYYLAAFNVSDLAEARYNFTINATDYVGLQNTTVKSLSFRVDRNPPSTYATVGPINDSDHDGNIEMSWTDDAGEPNATYSIFRSTTGVISNLSVAHDNLTLYNRIASGIQFFEDNTSVGNNATSYWYAIISVDSVGHANFTQNNTFIGYWPSSVSANDSTKPQMPAGLDCSSSGDTARLRWRSVINDTNGQAEASGITYKVYISDTNISYDLTKINVSYDHSGFTQVTSWITENATSDAVSSTGVYHYFVVVKDEMDNQNLTVNYSINYCNISLTVDSDSGDDNSGSSGTGGGAGAGAAQAAGVKISHLWSILGTGTTTMAISKAGIDFTELAFTAGTGSNNVVVAVTALATAPSISSSISSGRKIYQYLQVEKTNLPDSYIKKVIVKFKVEKKKLLDNSMSAASIVLMRYNDTSKKWADLPTSLLDIADPIYYYYQATSPGLSYFAIASKPASENVEQTGVTPTTPQANNTQPGSNETSNTEPEPEAKGSNGWVIYVIIAAAVLAGAGLGFAGYLFYRRRGGFGGLKVSRPPTMKMPSYKM
jgi:PGF-pre-PGF domain-containing protein